MLGFDLTPETKLSELFSFVKSDFNGYASEAGFTWKGKSLDELQGRALDVFTVYFRNNLDEDTDVDLTLKKYTELMPQHVFSVNYTFIRGWTIDVSGTWFQFIDLMDEGVNVFYDNEWSPDTRIINLSSSVFDFNDLENINIGDMFFKLDDYVKLDLTKRIANNRFYNYFLSNHSDDYAEDKKYYSEQYSDIEFIWKAEYKGCDVYVRSFGSNDKILFVFVDKPKEVDNANK